MADIYTSLESLKGSVEGIETLEVVTPDSADYSVVSSNTSVATVTKNANNATFTVTYVANGTASLTITSGSNTKNLAVVVAPDTTDYSDYGNDVSMGNSNPLDEDSATPESIVGDDLVDVEDDLDVLAELYPDPEEDEFIFGRDIDNGITGVSSKEVGLIVGQVIIPTAPAVTESTQNVSGMYGQHWLGNNYGAKTFNIPVSIIAGDDEQVYRDTLENISNAFIQLNNEEHSIMFGEWPDRVYYGHFTTLSDPAFISVGSWDANLTLTFVASDPKGYMDQETHQVDAQPYNLIPKGNAESHPIIGYTFKKDVKQFGYTLNDSEDGVTVGFSDSDTPDLKPVAYTENFEDSQTLTQIKKISDYKFDIPNGYTTASGTVKKSPTGSAIMNDQFYTAGQHDYNPNETRHFGNLLITAPFDTTVANGVHNWSTVVSAIHKKYYSRAKQTIQFYIIGSDGKRYGRFGIYDRDSGAMPHVFLYVGRNTKEESDNLKKGIGYDGEGNTAHALNQRKWGNKGKPKGITIKNNDVKFNSLTVDRQVTQTITSTSYYGYKGFHQNEHRVVQGVRSERKYVKVTTYSTPRDANGKKTGRQRISEKIVKNTKNDYQVPLNKIVRKKINGRTVNVSQKIELNSSQKIVTETIVWGNTIGNTTTVITQHFDRGYDRRKHSYYWHEASRNKFVHIDRKTARKTENVVSGVNWKVEDYNNSNAFSNVFARFKIDVQDKKLTFKVTQNDLSNGHEIPNSELVNKTFTVTFDIPFNRLAMYFGKALKQEDKLRSDGKTRIKEYADDWLEVTNFQVWKLMEGYTPEVPRVIAHAGDTATIDTETEHVFINGVLWDTLRSIRSNFPELRGGATSAFNFVPSNAEADIKITYRPSMR